MYENPTILFCSLIMETFMEKEGYVKQMNNKCALNIMVLEQKKGEYENRYFMYTEIKEPKLEKGEKRFIGFWKAVSRLSGANNY